MKTSQLLLAVVAVVAVERVLVELDTVRSNLVSV
jgi:hypothetical protein